MRNKTTAKAQTSNNELNVISSGVKIVGDMHCDKDFRMDGSLEGNLKVDSKIVLGKTGSVSGSIFAVDADISGEIKGDIEVKELLILRESARVNGDIKTNKIHVENGAEFNGTCVMNKGKVNSQSNNKPLDNKPTENKKEVNPHPSASPTAF